MHSGLVLLGVGSLTTVPIIFQNNRFIPVMPSHAVVGYGHTCDTTYLQIFKLIDAFGKLSTALNYFMILLFNWVLMLF